MRREINIKKENIIKALLEEYRALREEQKTRLTMNSTIINVLVLIIGGEFAAYVQMAVSHNTQYFAPLIMFSPIITTPLILFYYDNNFMIYRVGRYFSNNLYQNIRKMLVPDIFRWEEFHKSTSGQLWLVAFGRNIFFVIITASPLIIFIIMKLTIQDLAVISPLHPIITWNLILSKINWWEKGVLITDLFLILVVIITWFHSGLFFLGRGRINYAQS